MKNEVKEATVKAAGNGRFALEEKKVGDIVCEKKLKPMADVTSLVGMSIDTVLEFGSVEDCEKYLALAEKEGGYDKKEILDYYEHFMFGFDGVHCCLNYATWTVNHQHPGNNLQVDEKKLADGSYAQVCKVVKDIKVGDELYHDYRRFVIPTFYKEFMKKQDRMDVRHNTLAAVYGEDYEKVGGKNSIRWVSDRSLNKAGA
jgi:hypothetical protein